MVVCGVADGAPGVLPAYRGRYPFSDGRVHAVEAPRVRHQPRGSRSAGPADTNPPHPETGRFTTPGRGAMVRLRARRDPDNVLNTPRQPTGFAQLGLTRSIVLPWDDFGETSPPSTLSPRTARCQRGREQPSGCARPPQADRRNCCAHPGQGGTRAHRAHRNPVRRLLDYHKLVTTIARHHRPSSRPR